LREAHPGHVGLRRSPGFTAACACYISTPPAPRELDTVAAYLIYLPRRPVRELSPSPTTAPTYHDPGGNNNVSHSSTLELRRAIRYCNQPTYFTTEHRQPEQAPTRDSRRSRALTPGNFQSARARGRHVCEGRRRTTGLGEANRKRLVVRSRCRPRGSIAPRLLATSRLENGRPQLCHIQPGSQSPCGW
jgi:hypothetical protein